MKAKNKFTIVGLILFVASLTSLYVWRAENRNVEVINEKLRYNWRKSYSSKFDDLSNDFKSMPDLAERIQKSKEYFNEHAFITEVFYKEIEKAMGTGNCYFMGLVFDKTSDETLDFSNIIQFLESLTKKSSFEIPYRLIDAKESVNAVVLLLGVTSDDSVVFDIENELKSQIKLPVNLQLSASMHMYSTDSPLLESSDAKHFISMAEHILRPKRLELEEILDNDQSLINQAIYDKDSPYILDNEINYQASLFGNVLSGIAFSLVLLFVIYMIILLTIKLINQIRMDTSRININKLKTK